MQAANLSFGPVALRPILERLFDRLVPEDPDAYVTFTPGGLGFGVHEPSGPLTRYCATAWAQDARPPDVRIALHFAGLPAELAALDAFSAYHLAASAIAAIGMRGFYDAEGGRLEIFDPVTGRGLRLVPDPAHIPDWEVTSPLTNFAAWALADLKGLVVIHAAGLHRDGRGLLLCGRGGSGKSLLTLAACAAGLETVGDDYVLLSRDEAGRIWARPFSRIAKQSDAGLGLLGWSAAQIGSHPINPLGKRYFDLCDPHAPAMEVTGIACPVIGAGPPRWEPVTAKEVFSLLAESTWSQIPCFQRECFRAVGQLVNAVGARRLVVGPDMAANAAALTEAIATGGAVR